jgi:hypothetical protein
VLRSTVFFLLIGLPLAGQTNLVQNPSFEVIDSCPYNQNQVHFASPWDGLFTPELYNTCSGAASCSVPQNWTGYQFPHSGNGYAGLSCYNYWYNGSNINVREYLRGQMIDTLKSGRKYCAEFYVSRADASFWAINRIGMYISGSPIPNDGQGDTINVIPQIEFDPNAILTDTLEWVRISGQFEAQGGERYIAIGNFYSDNSTDTLSNLGVFIWCYFYVDDVALYELSECNAGNDTTICFKDSIQLGDVTMPNVSYQWSPNTGLSNPNISNPKAAPESTTTYTLTQVECDAVLYDTITVTVDRGCNSAAAIAIPSLLLSSQTLFISGLESGSSLDIYDERGRSVYRSENYQNDFAPSSLSSALYFARLTRPNGEVIQQKITVIVQ